MRTKFSLKYDVATPIACAGMSFAGGPELAAAVINAGGVGGLGSGYLTPDQLRRRIRAVRERAEGPLNVNFTVFHERAHLEVCIEERVRIVSFHWDLPPAEVVRDLHDAGIDVWHQAGTADVAVAAVDNGADLIIAQGSEAGGHCRGELPLFALLPEVAKALPAEVPLLAAGGITTGRSLVAAIALGADGGYVGTRFVASVEADAHQDWKDRLLRARAADTILTSVFGPDYPDFNPMRVIRNVATDRGAVPDDRHDHAVGELVLDETRLDLVAHDFFPPTRASSGDMAELPLLAGEGVGAIDAILPVEQIVADFMREARAAVARLSDQLPA